MLVLGGGGSHELLINMFRLFHVLKRGSELVPDGVNETYVLCGLEVDDGQLSSLALGDEGQVSTGFNLHGCAQRQCQICLSVKAKLSHIM